MIPVVELDQISQARLEDAKCLLSAGRFDGATYICGYAVEVGLKARICRTLNWPDFPSTPKEFQPYRSFQTHDLEVLLHLTGQEERIKQLHFKLWTAVFLWKPESRYNPVGNMERSTLFALFLREGAPDRWDLIVSAPWAWADQDKALDYMIAKIKSDMEPGTLTRLSRIVFMNPMDPTVQKLN